MQQPSEERTVITELKAELYDVQKNLSAQVTQLNGLLQRVVTELGLDKTEGLTFDAITNKIIEHREAFELANKPKTKAPAKKKAK